MIRKFILAAALLFVTPIASSDWQSLDCPDAPLIMTSTITWVRTEDPAGACEEVGAKTLLRDGACIECRVTSEDSTACTLYAEKPGVIDDTVLGHEVKHAFGCKHGKYF